MKTLIVWDSDYPWDIRVEKICNTLMENGWEVHLVCRNKDRRPVNEIYKGIHLHRLPFLNKKFKGLNNPFGFPAFFNPVWLKRIYKVARCYKVDLIIVRDLPLALAASFIGKIQKIPVILDMAECYPELVRLIWKFEPFKLSNLLIRNPLIAGITENIALKNVDAVFVMVKESRDRLINRKIDPNKLTIVSNTPVLERFKNANPTFPGSMRKNKDKLIILYVGLLNFSRGLDTVIESLHQKKDNDFYLVLVGTGTAELQLKEMVRKLNLESCVGFEGWVNNELIPEYVASSSVCLVPHHKCNHWDNTIPNKLFDYMAAGKAVLASDVKPIKRIIQETHCGIVYRDHDSYSFLAQLSKLKSENVRLNLGRNGMKAVEKYYNWNCDSQMMINAIEKVINKDG